jgi:hypothetical protein
MYYFLVYHDETHTQYLQKLLNSVQTFGKEFQIIIYPKSEIDPVFMDKHKNILSLPRGGGYWLWKPYMIDSILQLLNEGDVLFYLDAKYYFIENFFPWVNELLSLQDLVVFKNKPNEPVYLMKEWCKMDVLDKYNMKEKAFEQNAIDVWAGCILLRKSSNTTVWIKEWLEMGTYENITDSPSQLPNETCFKEHRHDQSLLSVLVHKHNIPIPYFEKKYLQNVRIPYSPISF